MKLAPLAAALVAAATLVTGCSGPTSGAVSVTAGPTAAAAPAAGSSLAASDFAAAAKLPNTVLLDVRTPAEFAGGHLPGAVNLDVESSQFSAQAATLDPTKSYAVYCRSGNRSKVAMTALQQLGITSLFDLSGGITAWQSAGGEIVTN
jgi:Rhodanese-related sulfurtransferase